MQLVPEKLKKTDHLFLCYYVVVFLMFLEISQKKLFKTDQFPRVNVSNLETIAFLLELNFLGAFNLILRCLIFNHISNKFSKGKQNFHCSFKCDFSLDVLEKHCGFGRRCLSICLCSQIDGALAAVDTTIDKKLGEQFKVQGFPTGMCCHAFNCDSLPLKSKTFL